MRPSWTLSVSRMGGGGGRRDALLPAHRPACLAWQVLFETTTSYARETLYPDLLRRFAGVDLQHSHVVALSPQLVSQTMQTWGQVSFLFGRCALHRC